MTDDKRSDNSNKSNGGTEKRGGYTPINEGYTPEHGGIKGGYTPSGPEKSELPQAPKGGSGEKDE